MKFGAAGLNSSQARGGHLAEPCVVKGENELTPEVSKPEGVRRDILSYMDARGAAREIDVMMRYAEKVEESIQTKEQLLEYQVMLQGSVQRLLDKGLLTVCKGASNLKRPEERMLMRVKHPMIHGTIRSSDRAVTGSRRGFRKRV